MPPSTGEIMSRGMNCLMEHLGVVEAERFVATVIQEKFDYTRWQREYFDEMSPERISQEAERFVFGLVDPSKTGLILEHQADFSTIPMAVVDFFP